MRIVSYNVNGIRAAMKKGFVEWMEQVQPDILCIQESKSQEGQVKEELFKELGYNMYWHSAEKKGYSGVITFSKEPADMIVSGMGMEKYDNEGRVLRTDFGDLTIINTYFPSGSSSEERHAFKMEFLADFEPWITELKKQRKNIMVLGDYNIVRLDIDIHNPTRKDNPSGFRPEEREWLDNWFKNGFVDAYRQLYPETEDIYSWWSYRAGSRQKNKGWRIDYISVPNNMASQITQVYHAKDDQHSDHAAIIMDIKL